MIATSDKRQAARRANLKPTRIAIGDRPYRVVNISREGIGIQIDGDHSFFLGQRLDAIKIKTSAKTRFYEGIITHITHQKTAVVCGIRFVLSDIEGFDHLSAYVEERSA